MSSPGSNDGEGEVSLNLGKLSPLRLRLPEDSQAPGPTWGKLGGVWRGNGEKERVENIHSANRNSVS